jgi:hypothetical protein
MQTRFLNGSYRRSGSHGYALVRSARGRDCFPGRIPTALYVGSRKQMFAQEVRHLLYGRKPHTYRVLFTIEGSLVYVLHIRHGRREPLKQ